MSTKTTNENPNPPLADAAGSASPRRITLKKNHNGRWALRMGELELRALVSMVNLEMGCGWAEGESPEMADAGDRLQKCLLNA